MTEAERIDAFEQRCRQYPGYPEILIEALVRYLKGLVALDGVRQELQEAFEKRQYPYAYAAFNNLPDKLSDGQELDTLDLRILDLCIVTNNFTRFLYAIIQQSRFEQAYDYVLSHGVVEQHLLNWMMSTIYNTVDRQGQITFMGQRLLSYLPERTDELLKTLENQAEKPHFARLYPAFITLLVKAEPPYLDLAWQITQRREQAAPDAPSYDSTLGQCAKILLEAAPARFTAWARKIAGPESPGSASSRALALAALMQQDPAQHIDLAVEAARTPLPKKQRYHSASVQITGLRAAIKFDPVTHWSLLEEAVISRNYYLAGDAIKLLSGANFDQARPTLQHCLANGDNVSALRALEVLLKQPWDGQEEYLLSLLAHRAKGVRERSSKWLVAQGQAAVEGIGLYLSHRSADARLAAVLTLARIGEEQATSLLAARLDPEKSLRVKEAILDVVGVPVVRAAFQGTKAYSAEAIIAEAEAMLQYVPRPALAWFDAQEAPTLRWTTGAPVPPSVLSYLLYRQSRVLRKDRAHGEYWTALFLFIPATFLAKMADSRLWQEQGKDTANAQIVRALTLIDHSTSGDLALALYRGWIKNGTQSDESWLLPLACALADDRLAPLLRRQIERWESGTRRALVAQSVRALALIESEAALDELNDLAKQFGRGRLKAAIKESLAVAARH